MSTNSTLNVLTPKGPVCFEFDIPIIWQGMLVYRVGMEKFIYYIECDEEVPKEGQVLYEGQTKFVTTTVVISKASFLELLTEYLMEFSKEV